MKGVKTMANVDFKPEDKIKCFDEISKMFYERNFGQASKSEIELTMFHYYLDNLIDSNKNVDGTIDYNKCSDYRISQELGITQQKVKNLKIKAHLIYPKDFDWKLALLTISKNARYDNISHKVMLNIPDPNLFIEIQNYLEENGSYIEKQLNSKLLQIRAEYYIDLIVAIEDADSRKKIIKQLKKTFKENGKEETELDSKPLGKALLDATLDICTVVSAIESVISPGNLVFKLFTDLLKRDS